MQLNGIPVKQHRKPKGKTLLQPQAHAYCRWESVSGADSSVTRHRQMKQAIARAVQLRGCVRAVSFLPDGIVQHGEWRRV